MTWCSRRGNASAPDLVTWRSDLLAASRAELERQGHRVTLKSALIAAVAAVFGGALAAGASIIVLSEQIQSARSAADVAFTRQISTADVAFTRQIGTAPNTDYVGVLIDAEELYSRAVVAITAGASAGQTSELIGEIERMIFQIKAAKAPVDLVATDQLGLMASLTIDLYGQNGGDLKQKLEGIKTTGTFDQPQPQFEDFNRRLDCAEKAGRTVFTETAQEFLGLRQSLPSFTDDCYKTWLDEKKWLREVR